MRLPLQDASAQSFPSTWQQKAFLSSVSTLAQGHTAPGEILQRNRFCLIPDPLTQTQREQEGPVVSQGGCSVPTHQGTAVLLILEPCSNHLTSSSGEAYHTPAQEATWGGATLGF